MAHSATAVQGPRAPVGRFGRPRSVSVRAGAVTLWCGGCRSDSDGPPHCADTVVLWLTIVASPANARPDMVSAGLALYGCPGMLGSP